MLVQSQTTDATKPILRALRGFHGFCSFSRCPPFSSCFFLLSLPSLALSSACVVAFRPFFFFLFFAFCCCFFLPLLFLRGCSFSFALLCCLCSSSVCFFFPSLAVELFLLSSDNVPSSMMFFSLDLFRSFVTFCPAFTFGFTVFFFLVL